MKHSFVAFLFLCLFLSSTWFSSAFVLFKISPNDIGLSLNQLESETFNVEINFANNQYIDPEDEETKPYRLDRLEVCNGYNDEGNCLEYALNLCPYISIQPNDEESTEVGFSLMASVYQIAKGEISNLDLSDKWLLSVTSPCFEGECSSDYNKNVKGNPLSQSLKGQTFKCDVLIEWNGPIFQVKGFQNKVYASSNNRLRIEAVLTGDKPSSQQSSILFIPGFMASDLYVQDLLTENQLWPPTSLLKKDVQKLMLNSDGTPVTPGIYSKNIISESFGFNIYKSFIQKMDELVTEEHIKEWKSFPYDWRKDISEVVNHFTLIKNGNDFENKKLIDEALVLAENSPTGKITIIGHSNGGLIGKALIKELSFRGKSELVDQFIMIATPQIGTPKAVASLLHGDQQQIPPFAGILMNKKLAIELGYNMQSAHNLLPSYEFFNKVSDPVITFDNTINKVFNYSANNFPQSISNYDDFVKFLTLKKEGLSLEEQTNIPTKLRTDLINKANQNIEDVSSWQIPSGIEIYEIIGWGKQTIKGINYKSKQENVCYSKNFFYICEPQNFWDRKLLMTDDGDGTVVYPSAQNHDNSDVYYFDLFDYNKNVVFDIKHHNILEASNIIDLLLGILKKSNEVLPNYVYKDKPVASHQNLQLSVHSPVSLAVSDSVYRYTGLSTTTESTDAFDFIKEEIPNSYYLEIGDDKYIGLVNGQNYNVYIQGEGFGTFTFNQEIIQNGEVIDTRSFVDIPVTPETKATLKMIDGNLSESLSLDVDGDGSYDIEIKSNENFDPITYLNVMRYIIKNFNLKKSEENKLIKKIDNLIKLIEKDKIDKVALRSYLYSKKLNLMLDKIRNNRTKKVEKISEEQIKIVIQHLEELINNFK